MDHQRTLTTQAWLELLLLSLIWGGSFMAFRVTLDEIGVVTTVMHRVVWAAGLLWLYVLFRRLSIPNSPKIWGAFLVMGFLNNVIPFSLIAWGQLTVETGLTSIFNASTALFGVPIAAMMFADERMTSNKLLGVVLGFAGCVIAIGVENLANLDVRSVAQLAIIAASLSYALAGTWARLALSHMPAPVAAAGMLTGSSLLIVPAALILEGPVSFDLLPSTWTAIAYLSVMATAAAYLLYYRVLAMAGASNLLLCTLLIVPIAIVVGAVMRDEVLPLQSYAGFAVLVAGLLMIDGRVIGIFKRRLR